ncbi:MAG: cytochrome P450 [Rhodospirillaceae bacterium]|nr:MAG: cytochrome P450 [Rhodospirillaceae bacterium]
MKIPTLDTDLFAPAVMADPFDAYRELRDLGPICLLGETGLYAMGRHADVKATLANWHDFSSAQGVALNDICNGFMRGTPIASDPPDHTKFREILGGPLQPKQLAQLRGRLAELADERVQEVVGVGRIDAMLELARHLPLRVISELVGLPDDGRSRMLKWADAGFNSMGPAHDPRTEQALGTMAEMVAYICNPDLPARFREGSWSAELWKSVTKGDLMADAACQILQGYVTPSLDTTIFALGTLLHLLATNPNEWRKLKENSKLVPKCVNEALRFDGPGRGFSRVVRREVQVGDAILPVGARVVTVLPAANRDERRYENPDKFDILRDATDHVGFGGGIHRCVGGNLAMLELTVMLDAIVKHVSEIEVFEYKLAENTVLRGFESLSVCLH